jgi:hypothetical protein
VFRGGVERLDPPGLGIDTLDAPTRIRRRLIARPQAVHGVLDPLETAVVADIDPAIGAKRGAVGATRHPGDQKLAAIGHHAGQTLGGDLDENDRAVGHGDRTFREFQAIGDFAYGDHLLSPRGLARRPVRAPAAARAELCGGAAP